MFVVYSVIDICMHVTNNNEKRSTEDNSLIPKSPTWSQSGVLQATESCVGRANKQVGEGDGGGGC